MSHYFLGTKLSFEVPKLSHVFVRAHMFTAYTPFSKWREVKNFVVKKSVGEGHKILILKRGCVMGVNFSRGVRESFGKKENCKSQYKKQLL